MKHLIVDWYDCLKCTGTLPAHPSEQTFLQIQRNKWKSGTHKIYLTFVSPPWGWLNTREDKFANWKQKGPDSWELPQYSSMQNNPIVAILSVRISHTPQSHWNWYQYRATDATYKSYFRYTICNHIFTRTMKDTNYNYNYKTIKNKKYQQVSNSFKCFFIHLLKIRIL